MIGLPTDVHDILTRDSARKVFFVGAGVSKDSPTNFPAAGELSSAIVTALSRGDPLLESYAPVLLAAIARGIPACRLEVLLDIAAQGIGARVLRLLSILEHGLPNIYHYVLASALSRGHVVITTNFDTMIEQAYQETQPNGPPLTVLFTEHHCASLAPGEPSGPLLLKLHGSVRDSKRRQSYGSIRLTLASLANGLSPGKRKLLSALLRGRDVIFLGHSGRDDFDIGPFLKTFLWARRLLWVKHTTQALRFVDSAELASREGTLDRVESLVARNANSFLALGNTRELLSALPFFEEASRKSGSTPHRANDWRGILDSILSQLPVSTYGGTRYLGKVLQYSGHLEEAKSCFARNAESSLGYDRAVALDDLAQCHFLLRDFAGDVRLRRHARSLAVRHGTCEALDLMGRTWLGEGEAYRNLAQYRRSLSCFERARSIYVRLGKPDKVAYALSGAAGINRMASKLEAAEREYRRALILFRKGRDLPGALYARWGLAEVWKYRGSFANADRQLTYVRARAEDLGHRNLTAWAQLGQAELLRLRWDMANALRLYTQALETFASHDLAGRCWALEGRAQCKIIAGVPAEDDIQAAQEGFEKIPAALGIAAVKIDKAVYLMRRGSLGEAEAVLRTISPARLPPKDRANYRLVIAELNTRHGFDSTSSYADVASRYKDLGMKYAFVAAVIVLCIHGRAASERFGSLLREARWIARKAHYRTEVEAIRRIDKGEGPHYSLNLY